MKFFERAFILVKDAFDFARAKKIWVILVSMAVCAALFVSYSLIFVPPEYVSVETVAILRNSSNEAEAVSMLDESHHLATLFAKTVRSDDAAQKTVDALGLSVSAKDFLWRVTAKRPEGTMLVHIKMKGPNASTVQNELLVYTDCLLADLATSLFVDNAKILSYPTEPTPDYHIGEGLLWGLIVGLALGVFLFIQILVRSNKVEDETSLGGFNKAVLGTIPSFPDRAEDPKGGARNE